MRNHFGLAIRYSVMLRDEDLRNALSGDFLMPLVRNKPGGSQIVHAMTFVVNQGKTNKDRDIQYVVALRHIDVRRCIIGALAFYLLERWRDPRGVPDVMDRGFGRLALIYAGPDPSQSILQQVSHDIDKRDLDSYPIDTAFALAGFMKHPFHLQRDEAHPSNELQMEIFPFFKAALLNDGSVERREWVRACKDAMEEKIHELNDDQPLRDLIAATRSEDSTNRLTQQQQFLLMLVRMRRVILQDAADLDHPMLLQPMFHSPAFKEFQEEVRVRLSTPEPVEIQPWPLEASQENKKNAACVNLG
ncbi:hypothetical protein DFQ26_005774 [Actinomortierella ambigua]|nr:hypothetical protein DFQ26_005774 [Actinomortierella ambigua]